MNSAARNPCRTCALSLLAAGTCDGRLPCSTCAVSSSSCSYPPPPTLESAWTTTPLGTVQRWAEPMRLVPGSVGGGRLKETKDEEGRITGWEWDEMVKEEEDLRISSRGTKGSLLFPPAATTEDEGDALDLFGNPRIFSSDRELLDQFYGAAPQDPLHPTVFINTHIRAAPTTAYRRMTATFTPSNFNFGNTLSAAYLPIASSSSTPSLEDSEVFVTFRRADRKTSRPTTVGWGSFHPLSSSERGRAASRKGKERAVYDSEDVEMSSSRPGGAFVPSSKALWKGLSPIQQLHLSPLSLSHADTPSSLLVVRSFTSFTFLRLSLPTPFDPGTRPKIASIHSYSSRSDFDQYPVADFAVSRTGNGGGLAVDTRGSLFGWGLGGSGASPWDEGRRPDMFRLRQGSGKATRAEYSGFARVEYGGMNGGGMGAVVAIENEVLLYDLRSPKSSLTLLSDTLLSAHLPYGTSLPSLVTSLLSPGLSSPFTPTSLPTAIHTVCTTHDILLLDERMPGREVFRRAHDRTGIEGKGVDRTLSISEIPSTEVEVQRIAMASRLRKQLDIFTVRSAPTEAPQSVLGPYSLQGPPSATKSSIIRDRQDTFSRAGVVFLPLPPISLPSPAVPPSKDSMDLDSDSDTDSSPSRRRGRNPSAAQKQAQRWKLLEIGLRGELYGRVVSTGAVDVEPKPTGEAGTGRVWTKTIEALAVTSKAAQTKHRDEAEKLEREKRRKKVDSSGWRERLKPEEMLKSLEWAEGDELKDVASTALELFEREVGSERQKDGERRATTGYELLSMACATRVPDESDIEVDVDVDTDEPRRLPPFPQNSRPVTIPSTTFASLPNDIDTQLVSAAPKALQIYPDPPTHFTTLLPRAPPLARPVDEDDSPAARLVALSNTRYAAIQKLSSRVLLPRDLIPDEPTMAPNQSQPPELDPPPVHFCYLRPVDKSETYEAEVEVDEAITTTTKKGRKKKKKKVKQPPPSLDDAMGARLLLAEWHVGADPRSYAWSNPYDDDNKKKDEQAAAAAMLSQASSGKRGSKKRWEQEKASYASVGSSQFDHSMGDSSQPFPSQPFSSQAFSPQHFPSSSFPQSSQPQTSQNAGPPPPFQQRPSHLSQAQSQSQDWHQLAASQPAIAVTTPSGGGADTFSFPGSSQTFGFGGAASQTVPGAFGSRLAAIKERKKLGKGKKRVGGF